ncbi:MAG: NAD-dependent epimerase/dehydratase family protein [Spirochaetes bacterium]|jgi:dihydroflavonol-4-reductase|nr:NAD-dependent epimerase/dehydratase family protein [Spirochaetota bacterium]
MIALTGATGHLGSVLLEQFVHRKEDIRCIVRSSARLRVPAGSQVDVVESALDDVVLLTRISLLPGHWPELYRVNVEGTRCVVAAARSAGVKRLVYVGSIEAFPLEDCAFPVTEQCAVDPDRTIMEYGRSKAIAVQEVLAASGHGLDCVVCCPTAFLGPPDYRLSAMGRLVLDCVSGRLPVALRGGFDFADVRDVADGIIRAGENEVAAGEGGRVYLLGGRYVAVPELLTLLQEISGVPRPRVTVPLTLLRALALPAEWYYRLFRRPARFTRANLRLLSLDLRVDSGRAQRELGYRCRPIEETLADTVRWLGESGKLTGRMEME